MFLILIGLFGISLSKKKISLESTLDINQVTWSFPSASEVRLVLWMSKWCDGRGRGKRGKPDFKLWQESCYRGLWLKELRIYISEHRKDSCENVMTFWFLRELCNCIWKKLVERKKKLQDVMKTYVNFVDHFKGNII